ncbi:hypothetical protein C8Q76DRAFT_761613 [Earliella scabrosa]|nr:hypothetical protein C8Q76DRAFT_761613 [Earliella scabrosa]
MGCGTSSLSYLDENPVALERISRTTGAGTARTMNRWEDHPPERWATGGEPMTDRQFELLKNLCLYTGISIPFVQQEDHNGQNVTKAEASRLIIMFQNNERPTREFIDSLGRAPLREAPSHPLTWVYCHSPMTDSQSRWAEDIALRLGVSEMVAQKRMAGLTRGQASLLIDRLRAAENGGSSTEHVEPWFENVVWQVKRDVPLA